MLVGSGYCCSLNDVEFYLEINSNSWEFTSLLGLFGRCGQHIDVDFDISIKIRQTFEPILITGIFDFKGDESVLVR